MNSDRHGVLRTCSSANDHVRSCNSFALYIDVLAELSNPDPVAATSTGEHGGSGHR